MKLEKALRKNLVNIPGWRTNRKIVVIESDDWGSIRMPSREVYDLLLSKGVPVDISYFTKYDCLESEEDLQLLFETLYSFKDKNGAHPVITANAVVANPDFINIKSCGRKEYHFEPISETYRRYPNHSRSLELWKDKGMADKLLWPQYHGREHLNVKKWMSAINSSDRWELEAFEYNVLLGLKREKEQGRLHNYMAAFEYSTQSEWQDLDDIAQEGLEIFEKLYGFDSKSFVAPCSIRGDHLDKALYNSGVLFHQCGQQFIPDKSGSLRIKNRMWGQRNSLGQIYWRRNCTFEPSRDQDYDWTDSCLAEMNIAFRWKKPAVINSHRVNFIGSIFPENREKSLKALRNLIRAALSIWPEIEFVSSDALGDMIARSNIS